MGRLKRPENAHLQPGVRKRGDGRFYLTVTIGSRRTEVAAGSTMAEVNAARIAYGLTGAKQYTMPVAFVTDLWRSVRTNAREKGVAFELTRKDVASLIAAADECCSISGIRFEYSKPPGMRFRPWAPSIDRVSPAGGYAPGNVRVVCAYVNLAMNEFGEATLRTVARRIARARIAETSLFAEISTNETRVVSA